MLKLQPNTDVKYVKGVGPRRAEVLVSHGIATVGQLLFYFPRKYVDRSQVAKIASLRENDYKTVVGRVLGKGLLKGGKTRLEVIIGDDSGHLALLWFAGYRYLEKQFRKGDELAVTGTVSFFNGYQMIHPEYEFLDDAMTETIHTGRVVPIYSLTSELTEAGLTSRTLRRLIRTALDGLGDDVPDYLPDPVVSQEHLPSLVRALHQIHFPDDAADAEAARRRLAFDELLHIQLLMQKRRLKIRRQTKDHPCRRPGPLFTHVLDRLPFHLTPGQQKSLDEIIDDMTSSAPMNRLLQGDVGSGKTAVAVLAAVLAVESGGQAAIMVPTEILAEQHFRNWQEILESAGMKTALLIGSAKTADKKKVISALEAGQVSLVFGTHAVISASVRFADLRLAVVDEQHRFGVMQRSRLAEKGVRPDRLVMTATPIPRTLAMTLYGDLDFSTIPDMPPGRQPVRTAWRFSDALDDIHRYLDEQTGRGRQAFVIYPLIEKSEKLDLQAAEDGWRELSEKILPHRRVGLVHGRLKAAERDETIRAFRDHRYDLLVATTVIEVGIDIPGANILIIQHAERFGLAQLHQMRGRVGRGQQQGLAVAVAYHPLSDVGRRRLEYFASTTDGFKVAEADLELRGPGEFLGLRQHGLPGFRLANPITDQDLLVSARGWAEKLAAGQVKMKKEAGYLLNQSVWYSNFKPGLIDVA